MLAAPLVLSRDKDRLKFMRLFRWASLLLFALLLFSSLATAQSGTYTVQLEAAPTQAEADEKVKQLKTKGVEAYVIKSQVAGKGTFYRVRVGMFPNANEARKFGASLQRRGLIPDYFIAPFERAKEDDLTAGKETSKPAPATKAASPGPLTPVNTAASTEPVKATVKNANSTKPAIKETGASSSAPPPTNASFTRFQDSQIGFSFEYPGYWTGNSLSPDDAKAQRINAGALFKSPEDSAFLNAIWNELDKANSATNDNDLIIDVILKSMRSGDGTQTMDEVGRKVVEDKAKGQVKTFLDLRAMFQPQGQNSPLEFLGKAVIIRTNKGILLVATFYSKDAPATVAGTAEKIIASVKAPE